MLRIAGTVILTVTVCLLSGTAARADDELDCRWQLYRAANKYERCLDRATYEDKMTRCRIRYTAVWPKLLKKYPGTSCDAARFVDNGDGTVTDNLTTLVWEKKTTAPGSGTNAPDRHDVDNTYTWTSGDADVTDEDGTVFTDFLADLNSGAGFAGANGWRLPTRDQLTTILLPQEFPCTTSPCLDSIFGSDAGSAYWTSETSGATFGLPSAYALRVKTDDGSLFVMGSKTAASYVRAVRGGFNF